MFVQRKGKLPATQTPESALTAAAPLNPPAPLLSEHLTRPQVLQRAVAAPALAALSLQRTLEADTHAQRATLQRRASDLQAGLPDGAPPAAAPLAAPTPGSAGAWVQTLQASVQRLQDPNDPARSRPLGPAEAQAHAALQRSVAQGLAGAYRADRQPPAQRHAAFGEHLATLQRHPLSAATAQVVLGLVPTGERAALQRATDAARAAQARADEQQARATALHAVQRQLDALDAQASQPLLARIQARRGGGEALPASVQRHLEAGLNADLSRVRVHTDGEADTLSKSVNAVAFTSGQDIYFQNGRYDPHSASGLELLAHEATHTVQQVQGRVAPGLDPDAALEQEAQTMGRTLSAATPTAAAPLRVNAKAAAPAAAAVQRAAEAAQHHTTGNATPKPRGPRAQVHAQAARSGPKRPTLPSRAAHVQAIRQHVPRPTPLPHAEVTPPARPAAPAHPAAKAARPAPGRPAAALKAAPVHAFKTPATRTRQAAFAPVKLDAAQLRAHGADPAHARKVLARQRVNANAQVSAFLKRMGKHGGQLHAFGAKLSTRVQASARQAKTRVNAAATRHRAALNASITALKGRAQARSGAALAQIRARAAATLAQLPAATRLAKTNITAAHTRALAQVTADAQAEKAHVTALYNTTAGGYRQAGTQVGGEASARANAKAQEFLSHVTGKDDSFLDGPVTDDRWKARADAARQVGAAYQSGFAEEGGKQATHLLGPDGGLGKDLASIDEAARGSREQLRVKREAAFRKLDADEARTRQQTQAAQAQLSAALQAQLRATLAQLEGARGSGLAAIARTAAQQAGALDQQANGAVQALHRNVTLIAGQLDRTLATFAGQVRGAQAPDPKALKRALGQAEAQISRMVTGARTKLSGGLTGLTVRLAAGARSAESGLAGIASGARAGATATAGGFDRSASALTAQALRTFQSLAQAHTKSTAQDAKHATQDFQGVQKDLQTLYKNARSGMSEGLQKSVTGLLDALRANLSELDKAIAENAEKAAAQVQPRWKGWLKIALMIAVVIVVAVVAGPLVIGAVGAMAGALGASAAAAGVIGAVVGGAVVGAAAGAVTQIGNNAIDNIGVDAKFQKSLFDGVGKAALIGAIGGAIGGAGGAISQGLGKAGMLGSGMTQKAAGFAVNTAFDLGGNVAGDLATGAGLGDALKNLTSPESIMMYAIATGTGAATHRLPGGIGKIQTGAHNVGERFGTHVGERVANLSGYKGAPVPIHVNPHAAPNTLEITGYGQSRTRMTVSPDAHPHDIAVHDAHARQVRADTSVPGRLKEQLNNLMGHSTDAPIGSRPWELNVEASKHAEMAKWREAEAAKLPTTDPQRQRYLQEAHELRLREAEFRQQANDPAVKDQAPLGHIDRSDYPNLTPEEYKAFRQRIDNATTEAEQWQARYDRYQTDRSRGGNPVQTFEEWLPGAQRAHQNGARGSAVENAVLDEVGAVNNNFNALPDGTPRTVVTHPVEIDGNTITVRPDGVTDRVWIDVKSLEGQNVVHDFTQQLRGELHGALQENKQLAVILSSSNPDVRPSRNLGRAENVTVYRRDATTGEWFQWSARRGAERWVPVTLDDVKSGCGTLPSGD
ncbi:DUF4157 domain-containing protein [Deinococcus maricopensis]|uniref:eCIS core domain-containing protein n=1 Tax=Deinococcus maricopensis (strain DSM 21211 / LMG 22137 / NRRL B-23946 / LB-34) TaxID=709986 RepID=E8U5F7_DEIML|nr:DUF4157 domain-containing protein [Deinococcus maricopensis]ADV66296.1 hypothetical protein Deima_0639 [Deinococcus maricopensis DSM 21211]